ncbi:hypothetical protein J6590_094313 [Homalodisca vitripennis]|nr:hypothetical protein J6590_094313 [Homalodisca vitripennis]
MLSSILGFPSLSGVGTARASLGPYEWSEDDTLRLNQELGGAPPLGRYAVALVPIFPGRSIKQIRDKVASLVRSGRLRAVDQPDIGPGRGGGLADVQVPPPAPVGLPGDGVAPAIGGGDINEGGALALGICEDRRVAIMGFGEYV